MPTILIHNHITIIYIQTYIFMPIRQIYNIPETSYSQHVTNYLTYHPASKVFSGHCLYFDISFFRQQYFYRISELTEFFPSIFNITRSSSYPQVFFWTNNRPMLTKIIQLCQHRFSLEGLILCSFLMGVQFSFVSNLGYFKYSSTIFYYHAKG